MATMDETGTTLVMAAINTGRPQVALSLLAHGAPAAVRSLLLHLHPQDPPPPAQPCSSLSATSSVRVAVDPPASAISARGRPTSTLTASLVPLSSVASFAPALAAQVTQEMRDSLVQLCSTRRHALHPALLQQQGAFMFGLGFGQPFGQPCAVRHRGARRRGGNSNLILQPLGAAVQTFVARANNAMPRRGPQKGGPDIDFHSWWPALSGVTCPSNTLPFWAILLDDTQR